MPVTVDQVKLWIICNGIGHAVASRNGSWAFTACGSLISGDGQESRPKRICRKCRVMLLQATLSGKE